MFRKKVLSVLLAGVLLLCSFHSAGASRSDAAVTVTAGQLSGAASIMAKLRGLTRDQARQGVIIAQTAVDKINTGSSWLNPAEENRLTSIGLTKSSLNQALNEVRLAINDDAQWAGLTSTDLATQLSFASNLASRVINKLSTQLINNVKGRGLTIGDMVTLALDLFDIRISSWEELVSQVYAKTLANSAIQSKIGHSTATHYGFKKENMNKALDQLAADQKEQFRQILVSLGIWVVVVPGGGGGGGGGGPSKKVKVITDQELNSAIEASKTTGTVFLQCDPPGLTLTLEQLKRIAASGKPLQVKIGDVIYTLDVKAALAVRLLNRIALNGNPPEAEVYHLEALKPAGIDLSTAGSIALTADKVSDSKAKELSDDAAAGQYKIAGEIWQLSVKALMKNGYEQTFSQLNYNIKVSLPVPNSARKSAQDGYLAGGRYNTGTGSWDEVPGDYDEKSGAMQFETNKLSYWALLEKKAKTFSDISSHWARRDIEYMATNGYVAGMGGGVFGPDQPVTRAQFAAMLSNALKLTAQGSATFTDVPPGEWYSGFVARAYAAGLVKGYSADRFAPEDLITREQMAAMICNALQIRGLPAGEDDVEKSLALYADQSAISGWARVPAARAVKHGLITGRIYDSGLVFAPRDNATRAEAAVMLKKLLGLKK